MSRKRSAAVTISPITLPTVHPGQKLPQVIRQALKEHEFDLRDRDIVCVASKVISIAEGRIVNLEQKQVSDTAKRLATKYSMNPHLAQIVLEQSDLVCGGVRGFLLTMTQGILTANAGVDLKNSPSGTATLWPAHPNHSASVLRASLMRDRNARIGVVIVDSRVTPLRLGTVGMAIGISGFRGIRDERRMRDLYGRKVIATRTNLADDLASAAHLVMGERDERKGLVVVQGAPITITSARDKLALNVRRCLIGSSLVSSTSQVRGASKQRLVRYD